jgi:hypothetical protein
MTETDKQDVTLSPKARELLTELADFLDRLPEERFDYTRWVGRDWRGSPDLSSGCIVEMAHKHSLLVKIFVIGWALAALAMWTGGHR